MATLMLLAALTSGLFPPPTVLLHPTVEYSGRSGLAFHYHPYPDPWGRSMRQVANKRGIAIDWKVDGLASTPRCDRIGWYIRARLNGRLVWLQQVDCSNPIHTSYQRQRRLVLEVNWSLAADADAGQGWATYGGLHGSGRAPATVLYYVKGLKR